MGGWFQHHIIDDGRLPLFCVFATVLVGFGFIRFSVRMIRAQVKWWPGNVTPGGVHIHHVVFGTVFMVAGGLGGFALPDSSTVLQCISASLFGLGIALVLDEFALILHLEDVYWAEAGRTSVDAVFVAIALIGLLVLGAHPLDVGPQDTTNVAGVISTTTVAAINLVLVGITLFKGKIWTGMFGIVVPGLSILGAIRVGRPNSPWSRWRYREGKRRGPAKLARAEKREKRYREPLINGKIWLQQTLAGRPDTPAPDLAAAPEIDDPFDDRGPTGSPPDRSPDSGSVVATDSRGSAGKPPSGDA